MATHAFVTGASGKVASVLIPRLIEAGHTVTGMVRSEAKAAAVRAHGATCVVGDLANPTAVDEGLAGARIVFHLAGGIRGRGTETPDRINRLGTLSLLDRIEHADRLQAMVFASSGAVYGDRAGERVADGAGPSPHTRYGASKVAAEQALESAHRRGVPVRVARLAAVYGPGFPYLLEKWIRSGRAWLPGDGTNIVPTVHIDDAVTALMLLATTSAKHLHYNVADRTPMTVRTFYGAVARAIGGSPPRHWSPLLPDAISVTAARLNERLQSRIARRPRFTPDAIRLMTASVQMDTRRLAEDLAMQWAHPSAEQGLCAVFERSARG